MEIFDLQPFGINMVFFQCESEYVDYCNDCDEEPLVGVRGVTHDLNNDGEIIMGVFDNEIDTLAHEMVHVTHRVFKHIGSNISEDTEEVLAYLTGNTVGRVYKVMQEAKKNKRRKYYANKTINKGSI